MSLRRSPSVLLLLVALAALPACASRGPTAPPTSPQIENAPLRLLPGDVVKVEIWREVDLSGEFVVNERGSVILPLLGERPVTTKPFPDVRDELLSDYQEQLRNPSINITPLRRVNVLGYVRNPGLYTLDPTITLAGAVSLAGGAAPEGNLQRIRILREGQVLYQEIGPGATLNSADIRSNDQIFVDRRSWFERNSNFVISTTLSLTGIVIALLRRR